MTATLQDIAHSCRVSPSTVSLALRDSPKVKSATRHRVMAEAQRVGYQPNRLAQGLKTRATQTLGFVLPSAMQLHQAVLLDHLYEAAFAQGYQLQIQLSHWDPGAEARAIERCFASQVDGLILFASAERVDDLDTDHPLRQAEQAGKPCVFLSRTDSRWPRITTDPTGVSYRAAKHLIEQGYSDLRLLTIDSDGHHDQLRRDGFTRALIEAGIDPQSPQRLLSREVTWQTLHGVSDNGLAATQQYFNYRRNAEYGAELADQLLRETTGDEPLGLVCSNDRVAAGVFRRVMQSGRRVPRDVGLIGCDDTISSELGITSFRWDYAGIARRAIDSVLAQMRGSSEQANQSIGGELIVRDSSSRRP